ncbi:MAG: hypothetical protein ABIL09_08810 [Gemmatimonadota bacterium]
MHLRVTRRGTNRGILPALAAILLGGLLVLAACSRGPEPRLKAARLLGSEPEELKARLGEPRVHREEQGTHYGSMRWEGIEGVDVLVIIKGGKGSYVSYQFSGMEPFDEAAALARIGVDLPEQAPQQVPDSRARRWQPFGEYDRLTINPDTKLIAIGTHPL